MLGGAKEIRFSPGSSLRAFLDAARSSLLIAITKQTKVNFVVGNESADLDSISSSIIFAYLRSQTCPGPENWPSIYVPLLNIPRSDIHIRPELLAVLRHIDVEPAQLITLDDLPSIHPHILKEHLSPLNTRWCLVDHNALPQTSIGEIYRARVVGCIDHHKDEEQVPSNTGIEPRIIKIAGSCTSLVVNYFRDTWQNLSQASLESELRPQADSTAGTHGNAVFGNWGAQMAKFALASVLIDTNDLGAEGKVTVDDEKAAQFLEEKIRLGLPPNSTFNRHEFFREISNAKLDFTGMTLHDMLRKDYKQWNESKAILGISSVPKEFSVLLAACEGQSFQAGLQSFAEERKLDIFVVMTAFSSSSGEFQRQILLYLANPALKETVEKFLECSEAELALERLDVPDFGNSSSLIWAFSQRKLEKSRKQVAPLLREVINI